MGHLNGQDKGLQVEGIIEIIVPEIRMILIVPFLCSVGMLKTATAMAILNNLCM